MIGIGLTNGEAAVPRLGLCCQFIDEPIRFRTTTAAAVLRLSPFERLGKLSDIGRSNAEALRQAIAYCGRHAIGCFRVTSKILPLKTHPQAGYRVDDLPEAESIVAAFRACGSLARELDVRLTFHPDPFVVLNSPRDDVLRRSIEDLEYQAEVAQWIGADVINVHAGGAQGGKAEALERLVRSLDRLSEAARSRLTVENDDVVFTPSDLLPVCRATGVPLVYDVHHHRCLRDVLACEDAMEAAWATWNREPVAHVSSPLAGWDGPRPRRHHDFVDFRDFPAGWRRLPITVEIEAKAKERAVLRLRDELRRTQARSLVR